MLSKTLKSHAAKVDPEAGEAASQLGQLKQHFLFRLLRLLKGRL